MCVTHSSIIFISWRVTHTHSGAPLLFEKSFLCTARCYETANNFEYMKLGNFAKIFTNVRVCIVCWWRCKCIHLLYKSKSTKCRMTTIKFNILTECIECGASTSGALCMENIEYYTWIFRFSLVGKRCQSQFPLQPFNWYSMEKCFIVRFQPCWLK